MANLKTTKTYTSIPIMDAERVPNGIDLRGFFKSPDSPTPAVIPVKAGKIMAKTTKNVSALSIFEKISKELREIIVESEKERDAVPSNPDFEVGKGYLIK